jgi:hypothetical protein
MEQLGGVHEVRRPPASAKIAWAPIPALQLAPMPAM